MHSRNGALVAILLISLAIPACAGGEATADEAGPVADEVVARIGEQEITRQDVEEAIAGELGRLRFQEYELRRQGMDRLITKMLVEGEAEAREMEVQELLRVEVEEKAVAPTEPTVQAFYEQNKGRLQGRTFEQAKPDLERFLYQQDMTRRRDEYLAELRTRSGVQVLLEPHRVKVDIPDGEPSKGSVDAPVTIVEFSDFQCPFCKQVHPSVEAIVAEYGDKVRFVYRDYPLPNHPRALPASEASRCAAEQEKYWEYHASLMTQGGDLGDEDLKQRAEILGLDLSEFVACVNSDRQLEAIRASTKAAQSLGVNSTPTFFVNGRQLQGTPTVDSFREMINDELARAGV